MQKEWKDITVGEAAALKRQLEVALLREALAFKERTGLTITDIHIAQETVRETGKVPYHLIYGVEVTVTL